MAPEEDSSLQELEKYLEQRDTNNLSFLPTEETTQLANIQTPPLPNTGMPVVQRTQQIDPNTNLTRTQQALLSPTEQIIASRRTT